MTDLAVALRQAVDAFDSGHPYPAQSMAATVLTSSIQQVLEEPNLTDVGKKWRAIDPDASPFLAFRRHVVLRAVGTALRSYWASRGDPIPTLFNRHATAHVFDLTQFTEVNALAGLMLAVSFLRELQAAASETDPSEEST